MSPEGARWGVTDPDLKMRLVREIRAIGASVIGHLQALAYIIAQSAPDMVEESRRTL
ncbi:hypothetical protein PLEOSDRAFT_159725 [Pleurotus ostreatus PC15]|uniref:Uncharacterized protein n=1 Tax=Pleurotus ostreatus (strain PC15) TaxID=1137138 RepID=A0A067NHD7_PLEO1|nr:hypothetical protein PLEOSDRAFT_159725 [Pleurotus ostreatus PC15]